MPRPLKGSARFRSGRWDARITVGRRRKSVLLTTCSGAEDAEKAHARAELLAGLAKKLRGAIGDEHADLVDRYVGLAAGRDGKALDAVLTAVDRLCSGGADLPISTATTFRELGEEWTSGKLHERWPDHVKAKRSASDDQERLRNYAYPLVGDVPLPDFRVEHADLVMSSLPELAPATRRHVAQAISRVLKLAAYPARIITASPLPAGFLPPLGKRKAFSFLYPDEDRTLLGCADVPLRYRVLYGFLAREGPRRSEASGLTWGDLDLARGALTLDENKTDDPRAWALDPGVVEALIAWRRVCGAPSDEDLVFCDEDGDALASDKDGRSARRLREHLEDAKVDRAELFERSKSRSPIRMHDLRATFITLSLANGRTETWVADRTGHTSSDMINRYRRAARRVTELGLGVLAPLIDAIPELNSPPEGPRKGRREEEHQTDRGRSEQLRSVASDAEKAIRCDGLAEPGLEPGCPRGQRILNPSLPVANGADPQDHDGFGAQDATDRDVVFRFKAPSVHFAEPLSRAQVVRYLGLAAGELAAAGDLHAARVIDDAFRRLIDAPAVEGEERAEVVDLAEERRKRP